MYRALPSLRSFSAAIVLVATSFALAPSASSQSEDLPPPSPATGASSSCSDPGFAEHPKCADWLRAMEVWKQRQQAKQQTKPSVTSFALAPSATSQSEDLPPPPPVINAGGQSMRCDDDQYSFHSRCKEWLEEYKAWEARQRAKTQTKPDLERLDQEIARLEAEVVRLAGLRLPGTDSGGSDVGFFCTGGDPSFDALQSSKQCIEFVEARERLRKVRAAREQLLAESGAPPAPPTPTAEEQAAEQRLAEERRREAERIAAAERETEKLRKELEEARRQSARAEAERKAADEERRLAEERARQEAERLKQQAAAARKAAEEARRAADDKARREAEAKRLAEERARQEAKAEQQAAAAEPATTQDQRTQEQLAAIQKQLEALARQRPALDTDLPLIRATVPERVEVGDAKRITGLVGDEGSPPRLKVNGEPVLLFRLRAGQKPIAKHTLAFDIAVDAAAVGGRRYALEACDAAANCIGEMIALEVVAANRPDVRAKNYALLIGNNDHQQLPDLKTAIADATAVAEVLASRYAFERENVRLLLNADCRTILDEIVSLRQKLSQEDRLFLYYAGHGQIDPVTEEGFWQPVDAEVGRDYTWISNSDIRRYLRGMPAKHVLVVADSCFSGSLTRGEGGWRNVPKDRFFTEIDSYVSRTVISSGGTEPVADAGSGGHSVFAYYLLKALRDNDQPYVTSFELFNRLARAVTNNSNQKPEYGTVAGAGDEGSGDFTFILR